jgi:hypothetical protein
MKIECILKRDGGTKTDIGGVLYHFEPLADGAHVAEITEEAHIDRFLAIPEGYKVYHGKEAPEGQPVQIGEQTAASVPVSDTKNTAPLAGSDELPPQFEIGGKVITQLDAVQKAFEASGLSSDEWNELDAEDRTAKIEIALDELAEAAETAPAPAPKAAAKKTATKKA